jgi:hypothetical protein
MHLGCIIGLAVGRVRRVVAGGPCEMILLLDDWWLGGADV